MLVLTRKTEQKIQIGADITITILRVKGQSVRIGIDAPQHVRVLRAELPPRDEFASESLTVDLDLSTLEQLEVESKGTKPGVVTRDRSAAGSMPKLSTVDSDRVETQRGNSTSSGRMQPPTPRISSSLAERVAARRGTEKSISAAVAGLQS